MLVDLSENRLDGRTVEASGFATGGVIPLAIATLSFLALAGVID